MGYNSDYYGKINIEPALSTEMVDYINMFCKTRRMKRDTSVLAKELKGVLGFRSNYGIDGEFYIGADTLGTCDGVDTPPSTQPGLWCLLKVSQDGRSISWNGEENFSQATTWLEYIINNFIKPEGSLCNGTINVSGDDRDDVWDLVVINNVVSEIDKSSANSEEVINLLNSSIKNTSDIIEGYKIVLVQAVRDNKDSVIKVDSVLTLLNLLQDRLSIKKD